MYTHNTSGDRYLREYTSLVGTRRHQFSKDHHKYHVLQEAPWIWLFCGILYNEYLILGNECYLKKGGLARVVYPTTVKLCRE